jgi:hypothetical protein
VPGAGRSALVFLPFRRPALLACLFGRIHPILIHAADDLFPPVDRDGESKVPHVVRRAGARAARMPTSREEFPRIWRGRAETIWYI